ncbi:MAG: cytochrome c maturation protein CcmE [Peptococcaceae bacterium]|nr:cytochrome c maturation protein CcmE [Peptococcaceae bacterium]
MKRRHLILIIIVAGFVIASGVVLSQNLTPYVSFAEAKEKKGSVQVHGALEGDVQTLSGGQGIMFELKDDDGTVAEVVYKGLKPDNMDQSDGVVVIGKFDDDVFQANKILVKCPSKYESVPGGESL